MQVARQEVRRLREKLILKGEEVARDNSEMSEQLALLETRLALGLEEQSAFGEAPALMGA